MTTELPFALTSDSTSLWLKSLIQLNPVNSANQLNKVVQQLRKSTTKDQNALNTLIQLSSTCLEYSNTLEASLLSQTNKDVSNKSRKIEKLCIQLLRNTGLAFHAYCNERFLSIEEKILTTYLSIQFIGYAQRMTAIFHDSPSFSLWEITAELYKYTEKNKFFNLKVDHGINAFSNQNDIENVFKRNLLFSILEPYRHSIAEIKTLFKLAEEQCSLIKLKKESSNQNCFQWNSDESIPPCPQNYNQHNIDFDVNIDTNDFLKLLKSEEFPYSLDSTTLTWIINQMSGYKKIINSTTPSIPVYSNLLVGFKEVSGLLEQIDKLNKIDKLSADYFEQKSSESETGTEDGYAFFRSINQTNRDDEEDVPINSTGNTSILSDTHTVKILETCHQHFYIAETNPINCAIGDLALLCNLPLNTQLGIIRQIKITNQSGTTHLLIEKVEGTLSFHQIALKNREETPIIIVKKELSEDQLFVTPYKFFNGTQITSTTGQYFTLEKVLDFSPTYINYLIS